MKVVKERTNRRLRGLSRLHRTSPHPRRAEPDLAKTKDRSSERVNTHAQFVDSGRLENSDLAGRRLARDRQTDRERSNNYKVSRMAAHDLDR